MKDNKTANEATIKRLGFRYYATNAPLKKLSLHAAVLAYREEYIIERNFGRFSVKPLSLTPMYLLRYDHEYILELLDLSPVIYAQLIE